MTNQRAKASLLGIVMFLFASTLAAQVTEEWVARYDGPANERDCAKAIAIDDSGNVYVTGESYGPKPETDCDYATVKYNSDGEEQWVVRYDGPESSSDGATAIAVDAAGNVYVIGGSTGSETYFDYATVKYNASGVEQWVARYDGPESHSDYPTAIAVDDAGNVYVTGKSIGSETYGDYATVKYNSDGEEQWVARYDTASFHDIANAMAIDNAGNVYVTGGSTGSETYGDYATVKYNSDGIEQWVVRYDGPASGGDGACAIVVDDAGNVYVTGKSSGSGTYRDYATVKYNSDGIEQWVARYDGPISDWDDASAIAVDDVGNVYVTGQSVVSGVSWTDYATVKYNSDGEEQWVVRYDGPTGDWDVANAMAIDGAGNVYVTGESDGSGTYADYATVKYNSSGVEQWVARYNGPPNGWGDAANAIAIDDAGNVYVTGYSISSETDLDYATVKYSQGPGVAEASPDVPGNRLGITQLTPQPVITYTLPSSSSISLKIYDVTGKLVRTLVSGSQEAGSHTVTWDARNDSNQRVSAGLYFVLFETADYRATGKLVLVR